MIQQPFEARMMQYGYQQIRSDAQAAQLIRRELKGMSADQQRKLHSHGWNFDWPVRIPDVLRIKAGAWYKFQQHADGRRRKNLFIVVGKR